MTYTTRRAHRRKTNVGLTTVRQHRLKTAREKRMRGLNASYSIPTKPEAAEREMGGEVIQPLPENPSKEQVAEFERDLEQFSGTENYYTSGFIGRIAGIKHTDGVQYMAVMGRAHWLIDAITSYQKAKFTARNPFQVWTLTSKTSKDGHRSAVLVGEDGNGKVLARQRIGYTDFPLDKVKVYYENKVIMLPGER